MAKHRDRMTDSATPATSDGAPQAAGRDDVEQRVRRLERRLVKAREVEARRARKLERARRQGASQAVRAARRRKLVKARERGLTIERKLARAQSAAGTGATPEPVDVPAGPRAYCLRDRRTIVMVDPRETVMRNGRPALAGRCPSCGMRVVRPVRSRPS